MGGASIKISKVEVRRYRGDTKAPYVAEILLVNVATDGDILGAGFASAPP